MPSSDVTIGQVHELVGHVREDLAAFRVEVAGKLGAIEQRCKNEAQGADDREGRIRLLERGWYKLLGMAALGGVIGGLLSLVIAAAGLLA